MRGDIIYNIFFFFLFYFRDEEIIDMVGMFKNEIKPPESLWIDKNEDLD